MLCKCTSRFLARRPWHDGRVLGHHAAALINSLAVIGGSRGQRCPSACDRPAWIANGSLPRSVAGDIALDRESPDRHGDTAPKARCPWHVVELTGGHTISGLDLHDEHVVESVDGASGGGYGRSRFQVRPQSRHALVVPPTCKPRCRCLGDSTASMQTGALCFRVDRMNGEYISLS